MKWKSIPKSLIYGPCWIIFSGVPLFYFGNFLCRSGTILFIFPIFIYYAGIGFFAYLLFYDFLYQNTGKISRHLLFFISTFIIGFIAACAILYAGLYGTNILLAGLYGANSEVDDVYWIMAICFLLSVYINNWTSYSRRFDNILPREHTLRRLFFIALNNIPPYIVVGFSSLILFAVCEF